MTIAGKNKLDYQNVYVGEVWICSANRTCGGPLTCAVLTTRKQQRRLRQHELASISVKLNPKETARGRCEAQGAGQRRPNWNDAKSGYGGLPFSAVAYFFGRDLQAALKVPVGVIHTSVGGTRAEAWTSRKVLDDHSYYKNDVIKDKVHANSPAALYNGMILPAAQLPHQGRDLVSGRKQRGPSVPLPRIVPDDDQNWRHDWGQGEFPFLFVQLAPWLAVAKEPRDSTWAELREAQTMTLKLPHTGMAVITDLGHEMNIHPTPKQPVGERLSRVARAQTLWREDRLFRPDVPT